MSFRDLEGTLVDVLDRTLNKLGGDFEPERDIHSLMINRWKLRLRARAHLGGGPEPLRPRLQAAAGDRAPAVPQRLDRQQRLGRLRLHAQRHQRGLPGGAGPAAVSGPPAECG